MSAPAIYRPPPPAPLSPINSASMDDLARVVTAIADTEFVPKVLRQRPGAILAAILYGRALGLDGMVALREVHVIDGTPSLSATAILGQIRAAGHSVTIEEAAAHCIAHGRRADNGDEHTATFSRDDAERAGLLGKANWVKYERAMLRSRAVTELARALFSDTFAGLSVYTAEEVGAGDVDPEGEPLDVEPEGEPSAQEARARARGRHFARLGEFEASPYHVLPEGFDSWDALSKSCAETVLGVRSRSDLEAAGWDRLTDEVEAMGVPFG